MFKSGAPTYGSALQKTCSVSAMPAWNTASYSRRPPIDSFPCFGTDQHYLNYLARFVTPNGTLAIASARLIREIEREPGTLRAWWEPEMWCLHSAAWWRRHWERTGIMEIDLAGSMPDGWQHWLQ